MKLDEDARRQSQLQWTTNPCGKITGNFSRLKYFEKVEQERYNQQYWQLKHFPFDLFKGKKVLEIGIGHGTDLLQFAKAGAKCYGIDITDKHIALTRENFELRGLKVQVLRSDATNTPFPNNYFDCVYSFGVLHHIPEFSECLLEIKRMLKPDGVFFISVYNKNSIAHILYILKGLLTFKLFKIGYKNVLSMIEEGADGEKIRPYVKLYSKKELSNELFPYFEIKKISVKQVYFKKLKFLNFMRFAERFFGWYIVAECYNKK